MVQNWQTKHFYYQEGQEALYFQFQLNRTTLKIWSYVALGQNFDSWAQVRFWTKKNFDFRIVICRSKGSCVPWDSCLAQFFWKKRHPILHRVYSPGIPVPESREIFSLPGKELHSREFPGIPGKYFAIFSIKSWQFFKQKLEFGCFLKLIC